MDRKTGWFLSGLSAACLAVFLVSMLAGNAGFPDLQDETMKTILLHLRLPRALGALLAGSALAVSGALVQSVLDNPLASANLIGINAGAGFFTVLAGILWPASFAAGGLLGFFGGLLAAGAVLFLVWKKQANRLTVILAGMAISQLFSAGIDLLTILVPDALGGYASFKIGSLASLSLSRVALASLLILPGLLISFLCCRQLELFSLGAVQAQALGFPLRRWTLIFLGLASLLAAGTVSFCGMLGFVGLLVPAWLRRRQLPAHLYLIACALAGAVLVACADLAGRTVWAPWEFPAGLILSLAGLPYFLYLLLDRSRNHALS